MEQQFTAGPQARVNRRRWRRFSCHVVWSRGSNGFARRSTSDMSAARWRLPRSALCHAIRDHVTRMTSLRGCH